MSSNPWLAQQARYAQRQGQAYQPNNQNQPQYQQQQPFHQQGQAYQSNNQNQVPFPPVAQQQQPPMNFQGSQFNGQQMPASGSNFGGGFRGPRPLSVFERDIVDQRGPGLNGDLPDASPFTDNDGDIISICFNQGGLRKKLMAESIQGLWVRCDPERTGLMRNRALELASLLDLSLGETEWRLFKEILKDAGEAVGIRQATYSGPHPSPPPPPVQAAPVIPGNQGQDDMFRQAMMNFMMQNNQSAPAHVPDPAPAPAQPAPARQPAAFFDDARFQELRAQWDQRARPMGAFNIGTGRSATPPPRPDFSVIPDPGSGNPGDRKRGRPDVATAPVRQPLIPPAAAAAPASADVELPAAGDAAPADPSGSASAPLN